MKLIDFLEKYDVRNDKAVSVFNLVLPNEKKAESKVRKYIRRKYPDLEIPFSKHMNLVEETLLLNKVVKDSCCPNNVRNAFYRLKHKIIKHLFKNGYVKEVIDQETYYLFVLENGGELHQIKDQIDYLEDNSYNVPIKIGEKYGGIKGYTPFEYKQWVKFKLFFCITENPYDMLTKKYPAKKKTKKLKKIEKNLVV